MTHKRGFRRQQPKRQPTEQEVKRDTVLHVIEQALSQSDGPIEVVPRTLGDGIGVSVACVLRVLDAGEQAGRWFVEHLDDGLKVIRQPRRMAFAQADRASGRKGPQDRQKPRQPSHMQSESR